MSILLGVNIDHIATIRQARGTLYPDLLRAAHLAEMGGADGITVHLREDRRHIQEADVWALKKQIKTRLNLEMAPTGAMVDFALILKPAFCCLVPEKRNELTTEGGLDVLGNELQLKKICGALQQAEIQVSFFVDPSSAQIAAAKRCGASIIEIHTGRYADAGDQTQKIALAEIQNVALYASSIGLQVNAGHGLHFDNVIPIAGIPEIVELNIGHSIVSEAFFCGLEEAVRRMKHLLLTARTSAQVLRT
jgi:pyridoxine 5-phosphate synthase